MSLESYYRQLFVASYDAYQGTDGYGGPFGDDPRVGYGSGDKTPLPIESICDMERRKFGFENPVTLKSLTAAAEEKFSNSQPATPPQPCGFVHQFSSIEVSSEMSCAKEKGHIGKHKTKSVLDLESTCAAHRFRDGSCVLCGADANGAPDSKPEPDFGPVCTCGHTSGHHTFGHGPCEYEVTFDPKTYVIISKPCSCDLFTHAFPKSDLCELCDSNHVRERHAR